MAESSTNTIVKLNSVNWSVWAVRIVDVLTTKDLDSALRPLPEGATTTQLTLAATVDRKAFAFIRTYVEDSYLGFLSSATTALEAWDILQRLNTTGTHSKLRSLFKSLAKIAKIRTETITEYISRAKAIQYALHLANEPVSDVFVITALLGGLPSEYLTIVTIIEAVDARLTYESIHPNLIGMEQTIKDNSLEALAMMANGTHYCTYCKRNGHLIERCFDRHPSLRQVQFPPTPPKKNTSTSPANSMPAIVIGGHSNEEGQHPLSGGSAFATRHSKFHM
jgi:hypothetical protein